MSRRKFVALTMLLGITVASSAVNLTQVFTANGTDSDLFWAGTAQYYHSASLTSGGALDSWIFDQDNEVVNNVLAGSGQCVAELINLTDNAYTLSSEARNLSGGSTGYARVRDKVYGNPCGNWQGQ